MAAPAPAPAHVPSPAPVLGPMAEGETLDAFTGEYKKHGITFHDLGKAPQLTIDVMENIGKNDENTFKARVQAAYNNSGVNDKDPYCVVVAYTGHLAVKGVNMKIKKINVTGGGIPAAPAPQLINILIEEEDTRKQHFLWYNIVTGEDWFVECYFVEDKTGKRTQIAEDKCTPIQNPRCYPGACDSVNIDVASLPSVMGKITLIVNWVNYMRGGISFGGTNIVAICTKAFWRDITTQEQNQTLIHEVGHQIGMVPFTGRNYYNQANQVIRGIVDKTNLDPLAFQYTGGGHAGSHCHSGIALRANFNDGLSVAGTNCVMFGSTNGHSDFCPECAMAVKKVDLSNGVG
jgi:type VI secretion system secreted protein VgrG